MKSKLLQFKEEIINSYIVDKQTCAEIAKRFKVRPGTVGAFLTANNITLRDKGKRPNTKAWNKGLKNDTNDFYINCVETDEYKKKCDTYIRKIIRKYLIHKNGHKCMLCGLTKWRDVPIPLVCDHIDGNSQNINLENFRIICNNCDATLPTFKGKNRGKGRKSLWKDGRED